MRTEQGPTESKRRNSTLILTAVVVLLAAACYLSFSAHQKRTASKAFANLKTFLGTDKLGGLSQQDATQLTNTYGPSLGALILNRHGREHLMALDADFAALAYDSERNVVFYFCGNKFFMVRKYENGGTSVTGHAGLFDTTPVGIRYDDDHVFLQIRTPDESLMHEGYPKAGTNQDLKPGQVYTIKMHAEPLLDDASFLMEEIEHGRALILPEADD